jgi:hypothetical protein
MFLHPAVLRLPAAVVLGRPIQQMLQHMEAGAPEQNVLLAWKIFSVIQRGGKPRT